MKINIVSFLGLTILKLSAKSKEVRYTTLNFVYVEKNFNLMTVSWYHVLCPPNDKIWNTLLTFTKVNLNMFWGSRHHISSWLSANNSAINSNGWENIAIRCTVLTFCTF